LHASSTFWISDSTVRIRNTSPTTPSVHADVATNSTMCAASSAPWSPAAAEILEQRLDL
jgi:hypothetical protein